MSLADSGLLSPSGWTGERSVSVESEGTVSPWDITDGRKESDEPQSFISRNEVRKNSFLLFNRLVKHAYRTAPEARARASGSGSKC